MNPSDPSPSAEAAPRVRRRDRAARAALVLATVLYFVGGALFLVLREVVVPHVADYRGQIETALGDAIGLPVSIDSLSADWRGLRPRLHLAGLSLRDRDGKAALSLERVDATLAWSTLLRLQPHFYRIEIFEPELAVRRLADGQIFVAGLRMDPGEGGGGFSDWLLAQHEIVVRNASVTWDDGLRAAPSLRLAGLDLRLSRLAGRHRFALRARPPAELASAFELRGDYVSPRPADPASWVGQVYLALDGAALGGWQPWIDYPLPVSGDGGMRTWIEVDAGRVTSVATNIALERVVTRLGETLPELRLAHLSGRLHARRGGEDVELAARALELETVDGVRLAPTDFALALHGALDDAKGAGSMKANRIDFAALVRLSGHLPLDESMRARLAGFDPRGRVSELDLSWRGAVAQPAEWKLRARLEDIGLRAQGALPGLAGLGGEIDGNEAGGRFRLQGRDSVLELPEVFADPRLRLSTLRVEGGWTQRDGRYEIAVDNASFDNPDANGTLSGLYRIVPGGPGEIDLAARLSRVDGAAVWRYLPLVVNNDTRSWLRRGITGGIVPEARLRLKGDLAQFPFRDGASGQFLVTAKVSGARVDYAEGWPAIDGVDGELRFEGPKMRISAERGRIFGVGLTNVVAEVPELDAPGGEIMTITGKAAGPTADFLRFVSESPVGARIDRFTDPIRAEGRGNLDLRLVMPLRHVVDTEVEGEFRFAGNRLTLVDGLPPVADTGGAVRFTADTLSIPEIRGRLFGEALQLTASTGSDGGVDFSARGGANMAAVHQAFGAPALAHLSGVADWQAKVGVRRQGTHVEVSSGLAGVASSLPAPLNKSASASWPLRVALDLPAGTGRQTLRASLGDWARLELLRAPQLAGGRIERGGLALFAPLRTAEHGILLAARLDDLDVDAWRRAMDGDETGDDESARDEVLPLVELALEAGRMQAFGQWATGVDLHARRVGDGWKGRIASREVEGAFDWRTADGGALKARLSRLMLGEGEDEAGVPEPAAGSSAPRRLPALDIAADEFSVGKLALGRFALSATNQGGVWRLDAFDVRNADGQVSGTGEWRPGYDARTTLDFRLEAADIGRFLARVGYADTVRGGRAVLQGAVGWSGAPTSIDYGSLSGSMKLDAEGGQFHKLEPGVGRLLGVLSLQSLPRRVTLDFRDVLSEGFAFDRISGSIDVASGVMKTDDLAIRGPSARIFMRGSADIERETQNLRVTVQPTLSESVAIGAAAGLINPVAGVVTYLAQKALNDPIEKLFAFEYAVTGSWSEPKVEKLAATAPPAAEKAEQ